MGYGPQVAAERLRVAEALDALPAIEEALATGELSYSAVRELTRIATGKTDEAWVKACRGKNLRQIEELVGEREVGDGPEAAPKPEVRRRRLALRAPADDVGAASRGAEGVRGRARRAARRRRADGHAARARSRGCCRPQEARRPRYQVAVTVCRACKQGWQNGAGREIAIAAADVECAMCDAEHVSPGEAGPPDAVDSRGDTQARVPARPRPVHRAGLSLGAEHRRPSHRASRARRHTRAGEPDAAVRRPSPRTPRWEARDHRARARD